MGTLTKARLPMRIRFVGGCWHNSLLEMRTLPAIMSTADGVHVYHLVEFYTRARTVYWQYVHKSMIGDGVVSIATCREAFPRWDLDIPELVTKVRSVFPAKRQAFKQN